MNLNTGAKIEFSLNDIMVAVAEKILREHGINLMPARIIFDCDIEYDEYPENSVQTIRGGYVNLTNEETLQILQKALSNS